ncbi:helix-turn-helix transcriptional regulator [Enterococcus sp. BWM-S5]|uniref:Helix-turn-helix transcriptional regulator n=1 Tax=Enterococcus larvae TaxID=2794352 RepID=A0ABS4CGL7_9ENTE|nr:helix-turn-helix transcriptional regulator [Enterococcus larvae]MBP1045368.1 helix-turn-helix transcriptional regulator [Enterococcus larvae]
MDLGKKLKNKRNELGLTQQEVADKVFVTRQTISKWELGKSRPDLISLKLLEELLQENLLEQPRKRGNKMKITKTDILMTILFGVLFLPIRFLITWIKPRFSTPVLKYILAPIFLTAGSLYLHSLNTQAFSVVWVLVLCFYFPIVKYYTQSEPSE